MNNLGRKCSFLQHPPNRSFHALNIIVVYLGGWFFLHNKGKPFGELCWGWDSFLWDIVGKSIWQFESPKDGYPHISNEQLGDQKLRSNRGVNWKRGGLPSSGYSSAQTTAWSVSSALSDLLIIFHCRLQNFTFGQKLVEYRHCNPCLIAQLLGCAHLRESRYMINLIHVITVTIIIINKQITNKPPPK